MKKALLIAAAITTAVITPLNSAVEARKEGGHVAGPSGIKVAQ